MGFIDKLKQIITGFLATENSLYITTEDGLRLEIIDLNFRDKEKSAAVSWTDQVRTSIGGWSDKSKSS